MCIDEVMEEMLYIYNYQSVKLLQLGHLWPQTIQTTLNQCVLVTFISRSVTLVLIGIGRV
jgi:hypothetical protein